MSDPTGGTSERRRDPRRDVRIPATLSLIGLEVEGTLVNLSARGVCFVTENPHLRVEAANVVRIAFRLDTPAGDEMVTRHVRVTRVEKAEFEGRAARRLGLEMDPPVALSD